MSMRPQPKPLKVTDQNFDHDMEELGRALAARRAKRAAEAAANGANGEAPKTDKPATGQPNVDEAHDSRA